MSWNGRGKQDGAGVRWRTSRIIMFLSCLAWAACCSGAVIWAQPMASVTNYFDTGAVQIGLEEYQLDKYGRERSWKDNPVVLPGQRISRILRVVNHGNTCYIRAKAEFHGTTGMDASCLYGIDGNWKLAADGYYYCLRPLETGDAVNFFEGVQIPADFEQQEEEKQFQLAVQVDAIQSRNLTPVFSEKNPWGEVEILEVENEEAGELRIVQSEVRKQFIVEYQGEAAKLIINEENFFGNVPTLLPGDEYTDGARLINNGDRPVRLFFRSRVENGSDLLDKISLIIETEVDGKTEVIYDGPLRGDDLSADLLLMTIPAQSSGRMVFAVYVPEELDNEYILRNEAIQWFFSTEELVMPDQAPDTGDHRIVGGYMMLAGLSLGFAVRMIQRKRRTDVEER